MQVSPKDLLEVIGDLYVTVQLLKTQLAEAQQALAAKDKLHGDLSQSVRRGGEGLYPVPESNQRTS